MLGEHKCTDEFSDEEFQKVLNRAYEALDEASDAGNRGMATTLTFLAFHTHGALAAHIGDSRIYQIRPGEGIIYRSEDHSLVNALLRSGNISPEEAKNHPKRNIITRCMSAADSGRERDDATAVNLQDIAPGDYFLLCTDGVTGHVEEEELLELYASDTTDEEKNRLLAERCASSADNNTAIQIHIGRVTAEGQEADDEEEELPESGEENVSTAKLRKKEESVHELSPAKERNQRKLTAFLRRLFK